MNKQELIDNVSDMTSLPKKDAKVVVEAVIDAIKNGILNDGKVSLAGFGTFKAVEKPARVARNPKTGESINVEAKTVTKFKAAKEMKNLG